MKGWHIEKARILTVISWECNIPGKGFHPQREQE
jgi:hypothetical protein